MILTLSRLHALADYVSTVNTAQASINILKQKPGFRDSFPARRQDVVAEGQATRTTDNKCTVDGCLGDVKIKQQVMLERGFSRTFTAIPTEPHLAPIPGRIWVPELTTSINLNFEYFAPIGDTCHLFGVDDSTAAGAIKPQLEEQFIKQCTDSARLTTSDASVDTAFPVSYAYQSWTVKDLDTKYSCGHWTANDMTAEQAAAPMIKDDSFGAGIYAIYEEPTLMGSLCVELSGITTCTDIRSDSQTGVTLDATGNIVQAGFSAIIKPTRVPTGFFALKYKKIQNDTLRPTDVRYGSSLGRDTPPLKGSIGEYRTNCVPTKSQSKCGLQTYDVKSDFSQAIVPYNAETDSSDAATTFDAQAPQPNTVNKQQQQQQQQHQRSVKRGQAKTQYQSFPNYVRVQGFYMHKQIETDVGPSLRFGIIAAIIAAIAAAAVVAGATTAGVAAGAADNGCTVKRPSVVPSKRFETLYNNLIEFDNKFGRLQYELPEKLQVTEQGVGTQIVFNILDYERLPAEVELTATGLQLEFVENMGSIVSFSIASCKMYSYGVGSFCTVHTTYEGQPSQLGIVCKPYICLRSYLNLYTGDLTFDIGMQSPGILREKPKICYNTLDGEKCFTSENNNFVDQSPGDYGNIGETDGNEDSTTGSGFWDLLTLNTGTAVLFFFLIIISIGILILDIFLMKHVITLALSYASAKKVDSMAYQEIVMTANFDNLKVVVLLLYCFVFVTFFSILMRRSKKSDKYLKVITAMPLLVAFVTAQSGEDLLPFRNDSTSILDQRLMKQINERQPKSTNNGPLPLPTISLSGAKEYFFDTSVSPPGQYIFFNNRICTAPAATSTSRIYYCPGAIFFLQRKVWTLRTKSQNFSVSAVNLGTKYIYKQIPGLSPQAPTLCSANGLLTPFCGVSYNFTPINEGAYGRNFGSVRQMNANWSTACSYLDGIVYDCSIVTHVLWDPTPPTIQLWPQWYFHFPDYPSNSKIEIAPPDELPDTSTILMTSSMNFNFRYGAASDTCKASTSTPAYNKACADATFLKPQNFYSTASINAFRGLGTPFVPTVTSTQSLWSLHYAGEARFLTNHDYSTPIFFMQESVTEEVVLIGKMTPLGTVYVPVYIEIIAFMPMSQEMYDQLGAVVRSAITYSGGVSWTLIKTAFQPSIRTYRFYIQVFCADYCPISYKDSIDNHVQNVIMMAPTQRNTDVRVSAVLATSTDCLWSNSYIYIAGVPYTVKPGLGTMKFSCFLINETATWVKLFCKGANYHAYLEVCDLSYVTVTQHGGQSYDDTTEYRVTDVRYSVVASPVSSSGALIEPRIISHDGKSVVDSDFALYTYSDKNDYYYAATAGQQIIVKTSKTSINTGNNATTRVLQLHTSNDKTDTYAVTEQKKSCKSFSQSVDCLVDKYPELLALPIVGIFLVVILIGFIIGRCVIDCRARKDGTMLGRIPFKRIGEAVGRQVIRPGKAAYRYVINSKPVAIEKKVDDTSVIYENLDVKNLPKPKEKGFKKWVPNLGPFKRK